MQPAPCKRRLHPKSRGGRGFYAARSSASCAGRLGRGAQTPARHPALFTGYCDPSSALVRPPPDTAAAGGGGGSARLSSQDAEAEARCNMYRRATHAWEKANMALAEDWHYNLEFDRCGHGMRVASFSARRLFGS